MKGKKRRGLRPEVNGSAEYSNSKRGERFSYELERLDDEARVFLREIIGTMIRDQPYRKGRRW